MIKKLQIGGYNTLTVTKIVDFGVYLDGHNWGEILLPGRYVPENCTIGDSLSVFVYFDSEDRIIATCETPKACVGQCAYLRVVDVNAAGAFLDWGLPKDLLVPYAEQNSKMRQGMFYWVYVLQDQESERLIASAKLQRFLDKTPAPFHQGQTVNAQVLAKTDLGYKVIIEHSHTGLLYDNEVFTPLTTGQALTVNIRKIRDDGKIDVCLKRPDKADLSALEQQILQRLQANHVSKKNFKRAISRLYKQRLIVVEAERIYLPKA